MQNEIDASIRTAIDDLGDQRLAERGAICFLVAPGRLGFFGGISSDHTSFVISPAAISIDLVCGTGRKETLRVTTSTASRNSSYRFRDDSLTISFCKRSSPAGATPP